MTSIFRVQVYWKSKSIFSTIRGRKTAGGIVAQPYDIEILDESLKQGYWEELLQRWPENKRMYRGKLSINIYDGDSLFFRVMTDEATGMHRIATASTQAFDYQAYGELQTLREDSLNPVTAKFTGKELDTAVNLSYFGARWYDAEVGGWVSPDPAKQYYNPYSYGGDPLNGIDPNGMLWSAFRPSKWGNFFDDAGSWLQTKWREIGNASEEFGNAVCFEGISDGCEIFYHGLHGDGWVTDETFQRQNQQKICASQTQISTEECMSYDQEFFPYKTGFGGRIGAGWSNHGPWIQFGGQPAIGPGSDLVQRYQDWKNAEASSEAFRSRLELADANNWYRNGGGKDMNVDIRSLRIPPLASIPQDGNLLMRFASPQGFTNYNDAVVYGTVTLYVRDGKFVGGRDIYDFDFKGGVNQLPRNISTVMGAINAWSGTPYNIYFRGSRPIKLLTSPR